MLGHVEDDTDEISPDLWQEAAWIVINAYFDEKGLVSQQIDSFDEFIGVCMTMFVVQWTQFDE